MIIFLIIFLIIFFIIAIEFFGTNDLPLLFEGMAARSMRVGVSIGSPLALGPRVDCRVRNRANLRSARAAYGDCIRAVLMSILALLV